MMYLLSYKVWNTKEIEHRACPGYFRSLHVGVERARKPRKSRQILA
jgi:hypothetical protein